jgi:cyanate lyase
MDKNEMTAGILLAKKHQGASWTQLAEHVGLNPVYVASCCHGENSMSKEGAEALGKALRLSPELVEELQTFPMKGGSMGDKTVPTDPLIYRFYEIMAVYGTSVKEVVQEMFGDGIMSAIDFTLDVAREEDPKGARVVITMNGKFLPYKKW